MDKTFIAIAIVFIAFFVLFYISRTGMIRRMKYLNGLLNTNRDPDLFLKEIDKTISKQRKAPFKSTLMILKAKGFIWKGDWKACEDILNSVSPGDILNEFNHIMWNYDMAMALFNTGRTNEAVKIIDENAGLFKKNMAAQNKFVSNPIRKIYALKDYYEGNYMKSEEEFIELNTLQNDDFSKAINHYYLGLIDLHFKNPASARENFEKAAELGRSSYLPGLIANMPQEAGS